MRRSITTGCLGGTLDEKLAAIAAAGFDAIALSLSDLVTFDGRPQDVRSLAASLGLTIEFFEGLRDIEAVEAAAFAENLDRVERRFDIIGELGISVVLVPANTRPEALADENRTIEQLALLTERAAKRGLMLGYLGLAWSAHMRGVRRAWQAVRRVNHPHFKIALNSFHAFAAGDSIDGLRDIPGDRIAIMQVVDALPTTAEGRCDERSVQRLPGEGDLDVPGFVAQALQNGYVGPLSIDVLNDDMRASSVRMSTLDCYRSLSFLEERVLRRQRSAAAESRPAPKVDLFHPPAPTSISGVSFLEFAGNDQEVGKLAAWLDTFGFRKVGRHRSKNVGLYRSGQVNIVLNAEPDSFAQSFYFLHGISLCAIGLRTNDAERALGRALAYGCARFVGRVGPNEAVIPSVRALDGSLVYFVDKAVEEAGLYETEFLLDKAALTAASSGTPKNVDHVALALPRHELDSWVLFFRAVLDFEAEQTWLLPDPYGMVRSRAVTSQDRSVRLPLSVSQAARTGTAHSVSVHSGAGVNHIAFSTDDLIGTVAKLKSHGARLLPIPGNYYDDLEIRFDLARPFVDTLRQSNILYDRIGHGEFLHVYSEPFGDNFFFEFVQRIGEYDQYGAANAPVRMAVLGRLASERQRLSLR